MKYRTRARLPDRCAGPTEPIPPPPSARGSAQVGKTLDRFAAAREDARRFHPETLGDVDPHRCWGDWLLQMRNLANPRGTIASEAAARCEKHYKARPARTLSRVVKTALTEESGMLGGYLVPSELRDDVMMDVSGESFFRSRATVIPMESLTLSLPLPDAGTAQAENTAPFFGGLLVEPVEQGAAISESELAFRAVELTAWDLAAYALESNVLRQDGGQKLDDWLRVLFVRSLAWYEDWYFINGNGVGQPVGVINAPGAILVNRATSSTFKVADSQNMVSQMYNIGEPCWLMNRSAGANLTSFTGWIPNGPFILHGAPIELSMKLPALGTTGDVIYVDPSLYIIGDREALQVEFTEHYKTAYLNNQSVWRMISRVDGQPQLAAPITLADGSDSTVSPYVVLH